MRAVRAVRAMAVAAKIRNDDALALVSVYTSRTSTMSLADCNAVMDQQHLLRCRKLPEGAAAPPRPRRMKTYLSHFRGVVLQQVVCTHARRVCAACLLTCCGCTPSDGHDGRGPNRYAHARARGRRWTCATLTPATAHAAGDAMHTHRFKGVGWLTGATVTVTLADAGLQALRLCVGADAAELCLCGACAVCGPGRWPPCVAWVPTSGAPHPPAPQAATRRRASPRPAKAAGFAASLGKQVGRPAVRAAVLA